MNFDGNELFAITSFSRFPRVSWSLMKYHFLCSPNPTALTPYSRLHKYCLTKTQDNLIACGNTVISQMNQARPGVGRCDERTSARSLCPLPYQEGDREKSLAKVFLNTCKREET